MSVQYELACQCGKKYPVETSQAGRTIVCQCGAKLTVPTMSKIKRLPLWQDETAVDVPTSVPDDAQKAERRPDVAKASTAATPSRSSFFRQIAPDRLGLFIVGGLVLIVATFFACRNVRKPNPLDVFYEQVYYKNDDKTILRDSSPLEFEDAQFYFLTEPTNRQTYLVDDKLVDGMSLFYSYRYFDYVKNLDLSDNFYDKYEALKSRRVIALVVSVAAGFVGLIVALLALFLPKSHKQVGAIRGSDWR